MSTQKTELCHFERESRNLSTSADESRYFGRWNRGWGVADMTKALEREIGRTVREKRQQLSAIREEVEDLLDYLVVLEARAKDAGKPRIGYNDVKKRHR